jgi:RNA polymerase sigma factor (sigma-70 family)
MPEVPKEFAELFGRPGRTWTRVERDRLVEWLGQPARRRRLLQIANSVLRHPEEAENVVQDFLGARIGERADRAKIEIALDEWKPGGRSVLNFLSKSLKDLSRDARKRRIRDTIREISTTQVDGNGEEFELEIIDATPNPEQRLLEQQEEQERAHRRARLAQCIEQLPPDLRKIVRLWLEELSWGEIAGLVSLAEGAAKMRMYRAKTELRGCLGARPPQRAKSTSAQPIRELPVDTLIIGGGITGLVSLQALNKAGFSTLLLEKQSLGCEQTGHSHVYIHGGHLYENGDLVSRLSRTTSFWSRWIARRTVRHGFEPSLFGFTSSADADERLALWEGLELEHEEVAGKDIPRILAGGAVQRLYRSPEKCLTSDSLLSTLREMVTDRISVIEEITDIGLAEDKKLISHVDIRLRRGNNSFVSETSKKRSRKATEKSTQTDDLRLRAKTLVFAAGAGNQPLLDRVSRVTGDVAVARQQVRQAHMLVIKAPRVVLEPLTGVFHVLQRLFIVSRVHEDEVAWLVSDGRSLPPKSSEDDEQSIKRWLPEVMESLRQLAPTVFMNPSPQMRWTVYAALKAEGQAETDDGMPHEERVDRVLPNLWVVWPTKLTLAPLAAGAILNDVRGYLGQPDSSSSLPRFWLTARTDAQVARERWQCCDDWCEWMEFSRRYGL